MSVMMWVMATAVVLILIGFMAIIGYVNNKMQEVNDLRESLIEWQNYVQNIMSDEEEDEVVWNISDE